MESKGSEKHGTCFLPDRVERRESTARAGRTVPNGMGGESCRRSTGRVESDGSGVGWDDQKQVAQPGH